MLPSEETEMIIGIDFGTCYSSSAIMSGLIPVTTFLRDTTGMGIPSTFMYSKENGEMYGEACETGYAYKHSSDIVRYMKRTVREDPANLERTITSGGKEFTLSEIIEKYLTFLIGEIKSAAVRSGEYSNTDIEAVTITAPVGIASGQMMASEYNKLLQEVVMRITNLPRDRVRVLQEPVAAAISYLYSEDVRSHYDDVQKIAVFDLGGGTLDVSIVEHDPKTMEYRILAKEGDLQLGGNDWDAALRARILEKTGLRWSGTDEETGRFVKIVTKTKVELTDSDESLVVFTMNGQDHFTRITREEFEECTSDLLSRAMDVLEKALDFDTESYPDKIVLVGGSSNMPQIARGVLERTGYDPDDVMVYEPSKAISKGAAVYAKLNFSVDGSARGPKVLDMASLTYGFESRYDGTKDCIFNMIYKGDRFDETGRISCRSDGDFIPQRDDQTIVAFNVYESESERGSGFEEDWFDFGNGETTNGLRVTVQVPPEYLGRARGFRMWVTMSLDANGILDITITDASGKKLAYGSTALEGRK